jgi:hypothetical protein
MEGLPSSKPKPRKTQKASVNSQWSLKRAPIAVLLMPGETKHVQVKPPMGAYEQPVVMAYRQAGSATIEGWDADWVDVTNTSAAPMPLVLLIVPSAYVRIASMPWGQIYGVLQKQTWFQKLESTIGQLLARLRGPRLPGR